MISRRCWRATSLIPWAANHLFAAIPNSSGVRLRGADIEAAQLQLLIRDMGAANPENRAVQEMVALTKNGYRRALAEDLLALARQIGEAKGGSPGGVPLATLLVRTLEVEADRSKPETSGQASSLRRERVMKEFFLTHYRQTLAAGVKPKVVAAFGRNHLHRGIDRRGVSTLGNFLVEFATAEDAQSFNVALFAAGGKIALGDVRDLDERKDDPAFDYLASVARFPATVFDMKPLREPLRKIPLTARTPAQSGLLYWADSYDAVVCYREVTPLGGR
jgi:Rod binding domain-containing protein